MSSEPREGRAEQVLEEPLLYANPATRSSAGMREMLRKD